MHVILSISWGGGSGKSKPFLWILVPQHLSIITLVFGNSHEWEDRNKFDRRYIFRMKSLSNIHHFKWLKPRCIFITLKKNKEKILKSSKDNFKKSFKKQWETYRCAKTHMKRWAASLIFRGNANQNYNEISPHTSLYGCHQNVYKQ